MLPQYAALYWSHRRVRAAPYGRVALFERWGGTCAYCDAPASQVDHIRALSRGGRDVLSNVLPACAACNRSKADKSLADWAQAFDSLTQP